MPNAPHDAELEAKLERVIAHDLAKAERERDEARERLAKMIDAAIRYDEDRAQDGAEE